MRKLLLLALLALCLPIIACGNNEGSRKTAVASDNAKGEAHNSTAASAAEKTSPKAKILVIYYSRSGNTAELARQIRQKVGGDMLELKTVKQYPANYNDTTKQAKEELQSGFRPELQPIAVNLAAYDTIYLGSPCWWGGIAPPVITFLTERDLAGKTIIPFSTHGGTGLGNTVTDVKKFAPAATVLDGLAVRGSDVKNAQNEITQWLTKLGKI